MAATWRVLINPKLWDLDGFRRDWVACATIAQSKGSAAMATLPAVGDRVLFVVKGHIVMTGTVTAGFQTGTAHQTDAYNRGPVRAHAEPQMFATIEVVDAQPEPTPIAWKGQRTWIRL